MRTTQHSLCGFSERPELQPSLSQLLMVFPPNRHFHSLLFYNFSLSITFSDWVKFPACIQMKFEGIIQII